MNRFLEKYFGPGPLNIPASKVSSMYKKYLKIAWPSALEGLLLSLMNSFDTMMVGRLGITAIAAVGLCAQPRMILLIICQALCVGTTALVARRRGANDQEGAVSTLKQSLVLSLIVGILITIAGTVLAEPLLWLAGASDETMPQASTYFKIISLAFIPNCWQLCICAALRGTGKTKITMIVNMIANVVNICLNYCLIGGHFGFPALGVAGAAIATSIGTTVGFLCALYTILHKDEYLSIVPFTGVKFDKATLGGLMKVGSGSIAEMMFLRLGFLVNGRLIAGAGTSVYAANQVVQQVSGLSFTLGDGAASASTALIGQSLGAEKPEEARMYARIGIKVAVIMSLMLIAIVVLGRNFLPTLFTDDATIIYAASICFLVLSIGMIPQNFRVVNSGCLRGAGDVKIVAVISLLSVVLIRPLFTYLFCYPLNRMFPGYMLDYLGPWISFDIDAFVRAFLLTGRVNKGKWVNIKL